MTVLTLQQLSISMEEGKVLRWLAADGDPVAKGEPLVEVETDKATIEVEAPDDGVLRIIAGEGTIVPVDGVLCELQNGSGSHDGASGAAVAAVAAGGEPDGAQAPAQRERTIASPAVRRLAAERGIDLATTQGSGPGGRIVVRDLETPAAAPAAAAAAVKPTGELRDAVVRSLVASWQQIPHIQIGGELRADGLVGARGLLTPATGKVTYTDLLAFALARALAEVPELNGAFRPDGGVVRSDAVHLSLAVATSQGVLAPVLRDVSSRSLADLAAERARLVTAARDGSIDRKALLGGTVTLSNLGAYPVDFFAPVVTGPQIATIATGRIADKPVAEGGWIAVRARLWVNVAVDHRAADGEAGARLLAALEREIASLPGGVL